MITAPLASQGPSSTVRSGPCAADTLLEMREEGCQVLGVARPRPRRWTAHNPPGAERRNPHPQAAYLREALEDLLKKYATTLRKAAK